MNEIDITTTQNITINYQLASVWERVLAYILDALIIGCGSGILFLIVNGIFSNSENIVIFFTVIPIVAFYTFLLEFYNNGQSVGKLALGLRVIRIDAEKTSFYDYLMRWVFRGLDIYLSAGTIAFIGVISSTNNQRTGDLLANTVVVSLKKSNRMKLENLLKLNKQGNYTPAYPNVIRLNEDTMLIVKEVLRKNIKYPSKAHKNALNLLVEKLVKELNIQEPKDKKQFLNALLKDYILLTR